MSTSRLPCQLAKFPSNNDVEYGKDTLPGGIRSRYIDNNNGIKMHVLEAGFEPGGRPCVVLLHGFTELAYTWRKQLLPLARLGLHVIAPDLRGYGRSAVTPVTYDYDRLPFSIMNRLADVLGLVRALGYEKVGCRGSRLGQSNCRLVCARPRGGRSRSTNEILAIAPKTCVWHVTASVVHIANRYMRFITARMLRYSETEAA